MFVPGRSSTAGYYAGVDRSVKLTYQKPHWAASAAGYHPGNPEHEITFCTIKCLSF